MVPHTNKKVFSNYSKNNLQNLKLFFLFYVFTPILQQWKVIFNLFVPTNHKKNRDRVNSKFLHSISHGTPGQS